MTAEEWAELARYEEAMRERAEHELAQLRKEQPATDYRLAETVPGALDRYGTPACHTWLPHENETWWEWHGTRCAMCGTRNGRLVTDHCHLSGLVRGMLCSSCNTQEGISNAPIFDVYRRTPPAVIFGASMPYSSPFVPKAQPVEWVVEQLGPRPAEPALASDYLARAAVLQPAPIPPERSAATYLGRER